MTEWFERRPGAMASQGTSDPKLVLVGDGVPDWVRLPAEVGGIQVKVLAAFSERCPKCDCPCRHLKLNGGICVAECTRGCGFLWYRPR